MTLDEYINNPGGKGTATTTKEMRELYKARYSDKLAKLLVREKGVLNYTLYSNKDSYICHMKVPSETVENFYYDVVFFMQKSNTRLDKVDFKVFSNCPSFVFTYTHAFVEKKLFADVLKSKMAKEAIRKEAKLKNPNNEIGYEKSIYFAYLYMYDKGLFDHKLYDLYGKPYSDKILLSNVEDSDTILERRQQLAADKKKDKEKEEAPKKTIRRDIITPEVDNGGLFNINRHHFIDPISPISNIVSSVKKKTSNTIGRVGGIKKIKKH